VTDRPSAIVGDQLLLNRRGAAMLLAALEAAARLAERNGVNYQGRSQWDDVSWLRTQAELVAEGRTGPAGSADGTPGIPFRFEVPDSASIWSTTQAAALLRCTPRAVVKAIKAGHLPAKRIDRTWVLREVDVRQHAARDGRSDGGSADAVHRRSGPRDRQRGGTAREVSPG
jgi:hypothetical protein